MQPQARALSSLDSVFLDTKELVEKKRPVLFGNADSRIADGDYDFAVGKTARNRDSSAAPVVLDGIRNQVVEYHAHARSIAPYVKFLHRQAGFQNHTFGCRHCPVVLQDFNDRGFEIHLRSEE